MEMKSGIRHLVVVIMMKVILLNRQMMEDISLQVIHILSGMVTGMSG